MALVSTQPLTEMSTRNLPEGKGRPARKADNLTAICEPIVSTSQTLWVCTVCYRDSFTFLLSVRKIEFSCSVWKQLPQPSELQAWNRLAFLLYEKCYTKVGKYTLLAVIKNSTD
jgi:hypothetical protein